MNLHRTFRLPLSPGNQAILQVPDPMSDAEWTQMMSVLDAMKPGILRRDPRVSVDATHQRPPDITH